jgi:hypothetical protein
MKKLLVSLAGGLYAFLAAWTVAAAGIVPNSSSSSGPALAAYGNRLFMAWAGEEGTVGHPVWYTYFNGSVFTPQAQIPGALTTKGPAAAAVGKILYVATTPPNTGGKISLHTSTGAGFSAQSTELCDAQSCAITNAAPALATDGATLFATWTTPEGAIMTASRSSAGWTIDPLPVPNAVANPATGPTLTVFQGKLRLAWLTPSGESIAVSIGTLTPSAAAQVAPSITWSAPIEIAARSSWAPAIGVLVVGDSTPGTTSELVDALFIAWTTPDSTVQFARYNPVTHQWAPSASPVPLGTVQTIDSPALASFAFRGPNDELIDFDGLGGTEKAKPHKSYLRGRYTGAP